MNHPHIQEYTDEQMALATSVSPHVSLQSIRLTHHAVAAEYDLDEFPPMISFSKGHMVAVDAEKKQLRVDAKFVMMAALDTEESKEDPPVQIHAVYSLFYSLDDVTQFNQEALDAFAYINGAYNVWPFWRELCQSATARVGLKPVTLNVLRLVRKG